jgi:septal ring factor EnvC (AmiA/AmiB activator)
MVYASCGDRKHPCTLKIIIFTGTFVNIFTKLQELQKQIVQQKNQIIEWKNNVLFGYETEETILDRFEKSKKSIAELNFALNKFYTLVYKLSYNNREWQKKCSNLKEAIAAIIFEIQQLQPSHENSSRKLCDAYERLEPLYREFRELKYAVCHVEKTSGTNYELVQHKNALQQYYIEETPPMVQTFHYYPKNGKKRQQQQQQQENTVTNLLTSTGKNYLKKIAKKERQKLRNPLSFTINVDAF